MIPGGRQRRQFAIMSCLYLLVDYSRQAFFPSPNQTHRLQAEALYPPVFRRQATVKREEGLDTAESLVVKCGAIPAHSHKKHVKYYRLSGTSGTMISTDFLSRLRWRVQLNDGYYILIRRCTPCIDHKRVLHGVGFGIGMIARHVTRLSGCSAPLYV
ncbi:hypothetical protein BJX70DRAFT_362463, partial [Aspergillus crustosus]